MLLVPEAEAEETVLVPEAEAVRASEQASLVAALPDVVG
jgi:hypothetical protein